MNDRSEDFEAIVASVEAGEVAGERGPQRAPWIKRPLVWVPILIVVAFVAGLLVPWPGEVEGPRPVGTMEAMDPEGDVTTHYDNVEPVPAEVRSWLDIRSVSIDSNGDEMSIRLVTAERDAGSEASAVRRGSRSFHISLLHDDRTIYSLTVSPDKDPGRRVHMVDMQLNRDIQASREVYRDAVCPDAEPIDPCGDPDLSPLRRTVPTGAATADVAGNTLTVRLDLGRLPKLLYGVSWHVTARGMLATGSLSIPHEDRVPDEGSLAFPPPKDEEDAPARDPSAG